MIKLGLMHAMLIDMALEDRQQRKPRIADAFVQSVAPYDSGLMLLRMMETVGMLDAAQREWLRRAERDDEEEI
jgi:lactam utilization protein B